MYHTLHRYLIEDTLTFRNQTRAFGALYATVDANSTPEKKEKKIQ